MTDFTGIVCTATAIEIAKSDCKLIAQASHSSTSNFQVHTRPKNPMTNFKAPISIRELRGVCEHYISKHPAINYVVFSF